MQRVILHDRIAEVPDMSQKPYLLAVLQGVWGCDVYILSEVRCALTLATSSQFSPETN